MSVPMNFLTNRSLTTENLSDSLVWTACCYQTSHGPNQCLLKSPFEVAQPSTAPFAQRAQWPIAPQVRLAAPEQPRATRNQLLCAPRKQKAK
jgi:hypothetical protein